MARAKKEETGETQPKEKAVWTYVGAGDTPPHVINFMGKQQFVRGKATEVSDPEVLAKIEGNPSFVQGDVDMSLLHKNDAEAKEKADEQRKKDKKKNEKFVKKHAGE